MVRQEILNAADDIPGWMSKMELAWLIEQSSTRKDIIEIGSWKGRSTKALALSAQGTVYSIDHWMDEPPAIENRKNDSDWLETSLRGSWTIRAEFHRNLANEIASGKCVPLGIQSKPAAVKMISVLGTRKVDMVFIDADHEYENVKQDIELYKPMLIDGGLLCGHDYPWPGVCKAVAELVPNHRYLHETGIWYARV